VVVRSSPSENENRARRSLPSLLLTCVVCVGVGFALYWFCVREGAPNRSVAGWVLTIIVATGILAGDDSLLKRFAWGLIPWIVAGVLDNRASFAAQTVLQNPTTQSILEYGVASARFLVLVFLWIVAFSDADRSERIPLKLRRVCQAILFLIGSVIGTFEVSRMLRFVQTSNIPVADRLHWLQGWASYSVLALYVLLVIRIALPQIVHAVVVRREGGPPSNAIHVKAEGSC
jgi:hypothetical protein